MTEESEIDQRIESLETQLAESKSMERIGRIGLCTAIGISIIASIIYSLRTSSTIPNVNKVQERYIPPSKIEITVSDLDQNGEKETIEKINGVPYLLKYDDSGRAVLQPYEIKPVK
ncbi:MAG: hypothetical protein Q7J54_07860 [Candidatus Woesearchaeota archaeon]|nr:hypothetical protein [Candidatus Woesearchaeota archaeon]